MLVASLALAADANALTGVEAGAPAPALPQLELGGVTLGAAGEPPAAGLPRLEIPPLALGPPEVPRKPPPPPAPPSSGQAPPPDEGERGSGPPDPVPVSSAPSPPPPAVARATGRAVAAPSADPAAGPPARGSGGTAAIVPTVAPSSKDAARTPPPRRRRSEWARARSGPQGFELVAATAPAREVGAAVRTRPGGVQAALAALRGGSADGALAWILALVAGTVLIAAMCADALGVGPRHDYLRRARRSPGRWPRWR